MTDVGDAVPWASLKWGLTVRDERGDVDLSMGQALSVFAAVELDRVQSLGEVRRALTKAHDSGSFWAALMDGARGLKPADAPGDMTLRQCFARLGVVGAEWHFAGGKRQAEEGLRQVLKALKDEAA